MDSYNIIDGLNEIFDDTCIKQVVSRLTRNPLIWKFLSNKRNFNHVRDILGKDHSRWTIAGVLESAAGLPLATDGDKNKKATSEPGGLISEVTSVVELSALSLRVQDYIKENSFGLWLNNLPIQTATQDHLWQWSAILSMVFPSIKDPIDVLSKFTIEQHNAATKLLAYTAHSDQVFADSLLSNLDGICRNQNLSWLVSLINHLDFLGDFLISKEFAEQYIGQYVTEKTSYLEPNSEFEGLLGKIGENRSLLYIAQKAENNELLNELQEVGKKLLSELLHKTGITNYDPAIFKNYSGFQKIEYFENTLISDLQEKIEKAYSISQTDSDSTRSIAIEIYQSTKREFEGNDSQLVLGYSQRQKIIDLLLSCDLIVECADLIDKFLLRYPDDLRLLRIAATLFNKQGNHSRAIRYYRIVNVLDSLSREEKISYAESLAYLDDFLRAYEVRASINALDPEDTKKLIVYAYKAGLQKEIDNIQKLNFKELSGWPLSQLLTQAHLQNGNLLDDDWNQIWLLLSANEDKVLYLMLLDNSDKKSLIFNLLEKTLKESSIFSILTIKLVQHYQERGDYSSISEILANVQLNHSISQREFEEGVGLLIQNGFIEKASQWLDHFQNTWQLSPIKKILLAEISLLEENFIKTENLLHEEIFDHEEDEKSLILYSLALLKLPPKSFPIGLNKEKISRLKNIKEKFENYQDFSDITLRILGIYLNNQDRIALIEKELGNANNFDKNEVWRLNAAVANEYFNLSRFDLAIQYFKEVERILPFNHILLKNLLECYLRLKLNEEAEVILHRMLAADGLSSKDLINISFDNYLSEAWISFLDSQKVKFPDSKEIQLLFALSSNRSGNYAGALESTKIFLEDPNLSVDDKLIAAQILAAAGDHVFAERIIEILFSSRSTLDQTHYLTATLIYQNMGNYLKALIMLNHLQPFDQFLSGFKLDLMIKNGNYADASKYLKELISYQDFGYSTPCDLPLIDAASWRTLIENNSYFEITAAKVWIANKNFPSALKILEEGFRLDPNDERLAYLVLELAKLTNRADLLDEILCSFDGKEIHSSVLICSLGESALIRGQEVLAAHYLSEIVDVNESQLRFKALQCILLKRNGNESDARLIYSELINEFHPDNSVTGYLSDDPENHLWLATLAYEMEDFSQAMDVSQEEITKFGYVAGLVNIYLQSLLGLLRQNVFFEILNSSSQMQELSEEQKSLFGLIDKYFEKNSAAEFDDLALRLCKAYIVQGKSDIVSLLEEGLDSADLRDLLYLTNLQYGYEKTELEYKPKLKDQQDLLFCATLIASEHPKKSLELIQDHINLLSDNPIHLALLAKIHFALTNYSEAYAAITLALKIYPEEYGWEIFAGEISQKKGDMIAAIEHFERANRLSKKTFLMEKLYDLHILTGSEQAIPVLESRFTKDPGNFDLAMKIALLCLNFNKPGKAVLYFKTANKLNPKDQKPFIGLSKLSAQIGNFDKALEYTNKGLQLYERDLDLLLTKTDLIKRTIGHKEAKDFLENQALLNDDVSADLQAVIADYIYEMHGLDDCMAYISAKDIKLTHSVKFSITLVKYLLIAGDNFSAKEYLEKTLNEYPDNAEVNALMGDYFRIQGDLDQSIGHFLRAINLDPSNEKYFINLFEIYNDQRDSDSAKETLKSGMKAIPYSIALPIRLAKYYLQHGLIKQASEIIDRALRLRPHDGEAGTLKNLINQQRLTLNHEMEMITK